MRKIIFYLLLLFFLCGCEGGLAIHRTAYHKWFPNARLQFENLNREQSFKVLQEVIDTSIPETWHPGIISKKPKITQAGIKCVFEIRINHRERIGQTELYWLKKEQPDLYVPPCNDPFSTYSKVWTTREPDEHSTLKWNNIHKVEVTPMNYLKFGQCWQIHIYGPWESESKYHGSGLYFSVFTEEARDKAIAALLWLCPKL